MNLKELVRSKRDRIGLNTIFFKKDYLKMHKNVLPKT